MIGKAKFLLYSVILMLSLVASLHAQVRYTRSIPIQLPGNWLFEPKYTPKQIYPTPDGGVIILGDCLAHWGDPDFPSQAADCGAIKLDANGNSKWQWWSRNFQGLGNPRMIGIDQDVNGRINIIINNPSLYNQQIGWIDQDENYSLQQVQWINPYGYLLNRAVRLSDNTIFAIGSSGTYPYLSAFFMHLSAQGDTLSTRSYPPDSLWIYPIDKKAETFDMELDTDGMPVSTCRFSDHYASVVKTDWNGHMIWRKDTNHPSYVSHLAITKIPATNNIVAGCPLVFEMRNNSYILYQVTDTSLDSLFTMNNMIYNIGYLSLIGHGQGIYLAGASQYAQVSIVNYSLLGQNEWSWISNSYDWQYGTERITILPDSSIVYIYCSDSWGNLVNIVKLNPDGTGNDDNTVPGPQSMLSVYPNPMMSNLNIEITLDTKSILAERKICIYNTKGQLVRTISLDKKTSKQFSAVWDGKDSCGKQCSTGTYIVRAKSGNNQVTKKIILIK